MSYQSAVLLAAGAALLAACATPAQTAGKDVDATAKPDPRIGPEVSRICFPRNINGWRTVRGDDDAIILREGVRDEYRVEFTGPCDDSDFRFAQKIGIENRPGGGCLTRGDRLLVEGPGDFLNRCLITKINEWNEDAADEEDAIDEADEGADEY
jgi:predicted small secreted protein